MLDSHTLPCLACVHLVQGQTAIIAVKRTSALALRPAHWNSLSSGYSKRGYYISNDWQPIWIRSSSCPSSASPGSHNVSIIAPVDPAEPGPISICILGLLRQKRPSIQAKAAYAPWNAVICLWPRIQLVRGSTLGRANGDLPLLVGSL